MYQLTRPITAKTTLSPTQWQLTIGLTAEDTFAPHIEPGQFFLAQCADPFAAYLRRAIFPANLVPLAPDSAHDLTYGLLFLFSATDLTDPGLAWLISRQVGEQVNLLGPWGRGFARQQQAERLLLLGSGPALGPLLFLLAQAVQQGCDVVLALEAARAADLYPTQALPPAAELRIATLDGHFGHQGSILDHIDDLLTWADSLCAVGPAPFYGQLKTRLDQTRLQLIEAFASVLLTAVPLHVCGHGICTLCTVPTNQGLKLACQDGPVFDLAGLDSEALA